ncbi:MAG: hypothetical protein RXP92_02665 [Candidatus Micrarchaeota archaeon]
MKTKEKDEIKKVIPIGEYIIVMAVLSLLAFSILEIASLQQQLTQDNLTIAQAHSQILNLSRGLAQANATTQALRSNLSQAQATINMQKIQIANLTNLINLNESQVIFNKAISINSGNLNTVCNEFSCYSYPSVTNITLHFNFTHAGYIVINTTAPNTLYLALVQNYSRTWFDTNSSAVIGILNFSVRSITMPVLPGWAALKLGYSNATVPYRAQLTITYYS